MVTDENFGELLIEGLEEAAAHRRGELPAAKVVRRSAPPRLDAFAGNDLDDDTDDDLDEPPRDHEPRNRLRR
ncbi:hypothetical protein [Longimicrobium sp.]|uniref:hypothetical protein n=1 Tax=Longimicrobium sp. TaxID=2029185 RepID=UPI003B3A4AAA